ncbi:MAG: DUF402 domain-containing protein [Caldilineaceae bacterium]
MMTQWRPGDTVILRNIARSDGTVTTAIPAIAISDALDLLALYIPAGTVYKNNWVMPPAMRVDSVTSVIPSAQRAYRDLAMRNDSIRLYLPGFGYSVGLSFDTAGNFTGWYGNMEAPFVRTPLGIDTRDLALDVVATPDGQWRWKDEDEFMRRLEVGIDSPAQHERVRRAGLDFIARLEQMRWPFNAGWQHWKAPNDWQRRSLPQEWAADWGTYDLLS